MFWSYVRSRRKDNVGSAPLKDSQGTVHIDPTRKAEILNEQFSSVFSSPDHRDVELLGDPIPSIARITVTSPGVKKLLLGLNTNKSTGPDGIPAIILKLCSEHLAPVLSLFFQASIDQGKIPDEWKKAHISPIFKKGDPQTASNYRPVSLTSIPCKLLEHIIHSNIMKHFNRFKVLTECQHGFRKFRSCETQLIETCHDFAGTLDAGKQTDAIFLDFSKAFDKVHHGSLLKKLEHYGIRGNIHAWLTDFLSSRTQKVVFEGKASKDTPVLSGVPQGTVLGPLLFLAYINDLPSYVSPKTKVRLFADDSAVYREINSIDDCVQLQKDLAGLERWEKMWSMQFHPDKCQLLRITNKRQPISFDYRIHGHTIQREDSIRYLGLTISSNMSWNHHIDTICKKARSNIFFLSRNFGSCKRSVKEMLYKTYVRPTVEYCSSVWDPFTERNISSLEKIQRLGARFVNNSFSRYDEVTPMLQDLGWEPLQERRAKTKVTTLFKARNTLIDLPLNHLRVSQVSTRSNSNYFIPYCRTETLKNSFYYSSIRLWNRLPCDVRQAEELGAFKSTLSKTTLTHA